jgi:hypothetical protein
VRFSINRRMRDSVDAVQKITPAASGIERARFPIN